MAAVEEMMKKKCLLIDLPEDLFINNILLSSKPNPNPNPKVLLLPIRSLLSLRCVCKYLRNLITSPAFIKMHFHHSHSASTSFPDHQLSNILVYSNAHTFCSLKFNDGGTGDPCRPEVVKFASPMKNPQLWGSCNGLLCLTTKADDDDRVCLWNPVTKEYKLIPPPLPFTEIIPIGLTNYGGNGTITYGFVYDRFIDDYKIIRCQNIEPRRQQLKDSIDDDISIIEFQVYTLGTNTWRKISTDNNPYKSYFVSVRWHDTPMMFVNGALHWIMSTTSIPIWIETKIVSFNIENEVFQEIQIPLIPEKDYNGYMFVGTIQVLRGCLCLFEFFEDYECFNVWMMMDYGVNESWTKLFTIDTKILPLGSYYNRLASRFLRFCENGEILIGTYNTLFAYDPIKNKTRHVEFGEIGKQVYQSGIYIESLVSLNTQVFTRSERRIRSKTKG